MENEQLKTLLAKTLESRKYSVRTIQAYTSWLNDLVNYYPVDLLINIDEAGLNEYLEHLKNNRKLSLASIRQAKDALKFTYNSLLKKKFNFNSYTTKWSDRPQIDVPTQEETLLIIDHIAAKDSKLAITLIYAAGLELTEALNIKIKDIDLINRLVKIPVNRNKGVREVIIPNVLLEEIKIQYLSKDKTAFLFCNADGSQYHATRLQKAFLKSKRSLGIKKSYSIKSLRYAYVKHLELLGIPVVNTIQHMKLSKAASLEFYSRIGIGDVQVTFSPLDRKIRKSEEEKHEISPYVSETRIKELSNAKNNKIDLMSCPMGSYSLKELPTLQSTGYP